MSRQKISPFNQVLEFWETAPPDQFLLAMERGRQVAVRRGITARKSATTVVTATMRRTRRKPNGAALAPEGFTTHTEALVRGE